MLLTAGNPLTGNGFPYCNMQPLMHMNALMFSPDGTYIILSPGFSLPCIQKIPGLFQDFQGLQERFSRTVCSPAMSSKWQLLTPHMSIGSVTVQSIVEWSSQVEKELFG